MTNNSTNTLNSPSHNMIQIMPSGFYTSLQDEQSWPVKITNIKGLDIAKNNQIIVMDDPQPTGQQIVGL